MTELLYYSIPIITECGAAVLSCEKDERSGAYKIILDRTMIYPEGGGQPADQGGDCFQARQLRSGADRSHFRCPHRKRQRCSFL